MDLRRILSISIVACILVVILWILILYLSWDNKLLLYPELLFTLWVMLEIAARFALRISPHRVEFTDMAHMAPAQECYHRLRVYCVAASSVDALQKAQEVARQEARHNIAEFDDEYKIREVWWLRYLLNHKTKIEVMT